MGRARGAPEGHTVDIFEDQRFVAVQVLDAQNACDVWMMELREHARLALEPAKVLDVGRDRR